MDLYVIVDSDPIRSGQLWRWSHSVVLWEVCDRHLGGAHPDKFSTDPFRQRVGNHGAGSGFGCPAVIGNGCVDPIFNQSHRKSSKET